MAASVRSQISQIVVGALSHDLYDKFRKIFINTCNITGEIPAAPGNEIRNAYDHFVKALKKSAIEDANRNITNGLAHIIHATTYCLMISIEERIEVIENYISSIEMAITKAKVESRAQLIALRSRRNAIFPQAGPKLRTDTSKPTADLDALSNIYNDLVFLLTECNRLYNRTKRNSTLQSLISSEASRIWENKGRPEGQDRENWLEAERVIGKRR